MLGPIGPSGAGRNPFGNKRDRIHHDLKHNLQKVPYTAEVQYQLSRSGVELEIVGKIDTDIFANGVVNADEAHVCVNWWTHPDSEDQFKFHYWESGGFDCGWHRQENEHVDGTDHYQMRPNPESDYTYEEISFDQNTPVGLLWEILSDRLEDRILARDEDVEQEEG